MTLNRATRIHYPESDGMPMAETDAHRKQLIYLDVALRNFFRDDPQVYVAGNMLLYFVQGDPKQCVAPDVFVVKGVPKGDRRTFKIWDEGKPPVVVFELTSESTRYEDTGYKRSVYAELGVREYFLFDPLGEYLKPPLRGYRLVGDEYVLMNGEPRVSAELGLELRVESEQLRLYDPKKNVYLLSPEETQDEVERLRTELEKKRGK
ncbi:MAG: Uma2 family endonuclease [Chloroflexi bacterium]|nr:Uma2 family endonuclease [Chloroflexota bacterium]